MRRLTLEIEALPVNRHHRLALTAAVVTACGRPADDRLERSGHMPQLEESASFDAKVAEWLASLAPAKD